MFSYDQVAAISESAKHCIIRERQVYADIYNLIEGYVGNTVKLDKKIRLMIGGTMGVNLLLGKERDLDDYVYDLYGEDPFLHANDLTNLIDQHLLKKKDDTKIVFMKTIIPYRTYKIFVDNRPLISIIATPPNSYDLIQPLLVKTFDQKNSVLVLSPEIHLIDLYRALYSPAMAGEWETALKDENKLFQHLKRNIKERIGGDKDAPKPDEATIEERQQIAAMLLKSFITDNAEVVLIGEHALHMLTQSKIRTMVLQILSTDPDRDFEIVKSLIIKFLGRNIPVVKMTRDLYIMQDYRIRRTTIKIGAGEEQKEIMYLYNSPQYDLIPFNTAIDAQNSKRFIQVGNPFVILRFLLIDFWMVRWVESIKGINEEFAKARLNSILTKILELRSKLSRLDEASHTTTLKDEFLNESSLFRVFPDTIEDYVGEYENENIAIKNKTKDMAKKYYDYFPREYYTRNEKWRDIKNAD